MLYTREPTPVWVVLWGGVTSLVGWDRRPLGVFVCCP